MKKELRLLITGKGGFVGRHLCKDLREKGIEIVDEEGKGDHTNALLDVTNENNLNSIGDEVKAVIHTAAKTSVKNSFCSPYDTYNVNLLGTLNLLEFARRRKVTKFIHLSTYLYGQPHYLPIDEKHPLRPHSPYGKSKLLAEQLCQYYSSDFSMDIVTLRPFYLYGPSSRPNSFIHSILEQITRKDGDIVLSAESTKRDFLYISDFTNLIEIILSKFPKGYNVYNVGYGKSHRLVEVVQILAKLLNKKITLTFDEKMRPGDVTDMVADISKVSKEFDWKPSIELQNGLRYTAKQYLLA